MESKKTIWHPKIGDIDNRIVPYLNGWTATEVWGGKPVNIPDVFPVLYFEYLPDKIEDREIQVILWVGWEGYDTELTVTLGIFGKDTFNSTSKPLVEVSRHGGTDITLFYNGRKFVNFPKKRWWETVQQGYFVKQL